MCYKMKVCPFEPFDYLREKFLSSVFSVVIGLKVLVQLSFGCKFHDDENVC